MKDENRRKLHSFILGQFAMGYSRVEIFFQLCKKFRVEMPTGWQTIDIWMMRTFFHNIQLDRTYWGYQDRLSPHHAILINEIHDVFQTAKLGLEMHKCGEKTLCKFFMLSSRYALDVSCSTSHWSEPFVLTDTFHGQTRMLKSRHKIDGHIKVKNYPKKGDYFNFFRPDRRYWSDTHFFLYRVYLDLRNFKCEVTDRQRFDATDFHFIPDSKNTDRFVLCIQMQNIWYLRRGRIVQNKFKIDSQLLDANFQIIFASMKLEGDHIYCLSEVQNNDDHYVFRRLMLTETRVKTCKFCCIPKHDLSIINNGHFPTCIWSDQKCYLLQNVDLKSPRLLELDLQTKTAREIKIKHVFGKFKNMFLDDYGILTICSLNYENGQHVTSRVLLRGPERLKILALFALRKRTMFMHNVEKENLFAKIPQRLRPFNGDID